MAHEQILRYYSVHTLHPIDKNGDIRLSALCEINVIASLPGQPITEWQERVALELQPDNPP